MVCLFCFGFEFDISVLGGKREGIKIRVYIFIFLCGLVVIVRFVKEGVVEVYLSLSEIR